MGRESGGIACVAIYHSPNPTKPNPTKPNPTQPNETKPNQTKPNQTKPNQTNRAHKFNRYAEKGAFQKVDENGKIIPRKKTIKVSLLYVALVGIRFSNADFQGGMMTSFYWDWVAAYRV